MAEKTLKYDLIARDRASRAFAAVGGAASQMHKRVDIASRGVALAGTAAAAGVGAAATAMGAAAVVGIKTAASLEQAQIAFETLLGSGQKAQRFLSDLKVFAAKTPFELPGLIDASRMLLGVGVSAQRVVPLLQAFGDTAGAVGIGQEAFQRIILATSQSISAGKIQLGDMNQLMENGLPIWKLLSGALHKPVSDIREMISQGKLLTKDVLPLLERQMHHDYGGAMAKQSRTLNGLWSTFMDTVKIGLADIVQPFLPALKRALEGAVGVASTVGQRLDTILSGIGKSSFLRSWIDAAKEFGRDMAPIVEGLRRLSRASDASGDRMERVRQVIAAFYRGARTAFSWVGSQAKKAVDDVSKALEGHQSEVREVTAALTALAHFIARYVAPVIGGTLVGVIRTVGWTMSASITTIAALVRAWNWLVRTFLVSVGTMVHGAAVAFGWIPKLGPQLRSADRQLQDFARRVNANLNRIQGKTIDVRAKGWVLPSSGAALIGGSSIAWQMHARGGLARGPGTATSDSIPAMLSDGEYVIPTRVVRALGVGFFDRLIGRPSTARPGDGSQGLAFADGGLAVRSSASTGRLAGFSDRFVHAVGGALGKMVALGEMMGAAPVARAQRFVRDQAGKPYVWAAAGPGGYDCSGIVSAAYNVMRGRPTYQHTFSTDNEAGFFPRPGWGRFTAGWANPGERGGGSVGHTAGNIGGLAFESRGGDGVVVGSGATSVGTFAHMGHFDRGGWLPPGLTLAHNGTGRPEQVLPPGRVNGSGTTHITINMPPGSDGADVVRTLQEYARRNGPIKLAVR